MQSFLLKALLGIIFSLLLWFPCTALVVALFFGPNGLTPSLPIMFPTLVGAYGSTLLILWHMITSSTWQPIWRKFKNDELLGAVLILCATFLPSLIISTGFGLIAWQSWQTSIYGAVALSFNGIPVSIAVSLIVVGALKGPSNSLERYFDIVVLAIMGFSLVLSFNASPFLLFAMLLALEITGAIIYVILRSFKLKNSSMIAAIFAAGVILFAVADYAIAVVTEHLYLDSLDT